MPQVCSWSLFGAGASERQQNLHLALRIVAFAALVGLLRIAVERRRQQISWHRIVLLPLWPFQLCNGRPAAAWPAPDLLKGNKTST